MFAQWLNGEIERDDVTPVTDLFSPDAMIVNARLPSITARRDDFEGVMMACWGLYSEDPVRSTIELRSSLDLGHERYLTSTCDAWRTRAAFRRTRRPRSSPGIRQPADLGSRLSPNDGGRRAAPRRLWSSVGTEDGANHQRESR